MKAVIKNSFILLISFYLLTLMVCGKDFQINKEENRLPKLLDLGAHKCIPCQKMAPILDELAKEYKGLFDVEFIDVWLSENVDKAKTHGIRSIPTQIFFDSTGKELWRHEGFISKVDILEKWKELGFTFKVALQEKSTNKVVALERD